MLTSETDTYYLNRAKRLGAVGYLVKPVDSEHLASRVNRVLNDPGMRWIDDLSVLSAGAEPAARPAAGRAAPPRRRRILSVEDVACTQQLVALFLEDGTCTVDQVGTGREALSAVGAKRYDMLLLDLRLPDIDGLEVIRRVRRDEAGGRRLPIVAVSADVLPAQVAEAMAAGADEHLGKPFTASALRAAVGRWAGVAGRPLDQLNPTVAGLARDYGQEAVEGLLRALALQLATLEATAPRPDALEAAAHAIKGAAASLGFGAVSAACSELEAACRRSAPWDQALAHAAAACEDARLQIADLLPPAG